MKRTALSVVLGVALAATSALASASTPTTSSSGSFMASISNWFACAIGQSSCVTLDDSGDPMIHNN